MQIGAVSNLLTQMRVVPLGRTVRALENLSSSGRFFMDPFMKHLARTTPLALRVPQTFVNLRRYEATLDHGLVRTIEETATVNGLMDLALIPTDEERKQLARLSEINHALNEYETQALEVLKSVRSLSSAQSLSAAQEGEALTIAAINTRLFDQGIPYVIPPQVRLFDLWGIVRGDYRPSYFLELNPAHPQFKALLGQQAELEALSATALNGYLSRTVSEEDLPHGAYLSQFESTPVWMPHLTSMRWEEFIQARFPDSLLSMQHRQLIPHLRNNYGKNSFSAALLFDKDLMFAYAWKSVDDYLTYGELAIEEVFIGALPPGGVIVDRDAATALWIDKFNLAKVPFVLGQERFARNSATVRKLEDHVQRHFPDRLAVYVKLPPKTGPLGVFPLANAAVRNFPGDN